MLANKFQEAWNNNDASALAALFTEDAVLVNDSGPVPQTKWVAGAAASIDWGLL